MGKKLKASYTIHWHREKPLCLHRSTEKEYMSDQNCLGSSLTSLATL